MPAAAPLILVDGSSYLYRAFHALPPLTAPDGSPTGALYGVLAMLRKLQAEYAPQRMVVVFDAPGKTFRDEWYPAYKATREAAPEDLVAQIAPLHALVLAMGFPLLCIPGVEADDVIATLATQAAARGEAVLISTSDKDLAQLVNEHITLINTLQGNVLDPDGVRAKFGVDPTQIVDYLTLIGDTVDNVPGVDKVGPKTAAKWIAQYGSLEGVLAQADSMPGKIGEHLRAARAHLPLSRRLITVCRDVPLGPAAENLDLREPNVEALQEWFRRLGFRRWLEELPPSPATATASTPTPPTEPPLTEPPLTEPIPFDTPTVPTTVRIVRDPQEWAILRQRLLDQELVALDTETTSLDYMQARIVGLSFCLESGEAWYLPLGHVAAPGEPAQLPLAATLEELHPWLESPTHGKLGHHLKYDRNVLANHGITLNGIREDTLLESYLLDTSANRHDLATVAARYLQISMQTYTDLTGKGAQQIPFAEVPIAAAADYAGADAKVCFQLHQHLHPRLADCPGPAQIYRELEIPLIPVLSDMERAGVRIDAGRLRQQSAELLRSLQTLEAEAHAEAGVAFNLGSPKQIQEILYERLGLPVLHRTPKGQPSTAEEALEEMADRFPLPRLILAHRGLSKLRSTYTERLPERIQPHTGRVHTSYHQAVTTTGRLSSSEPNLQNIPIRTPEGRRIRQAFIADPDHVLLAADYSQIELRILAHLSQDPGLLAAFAAGQDIHRATAAEVFGVATPEAVHDDQRRAAKTINFGLIYGMSAFGLARTLGIDQGTARAYMETYFARYPGVRDCMESLRHAARTHGYAATLLGRRLYLPDIHSRNATRRAQAERLAINAPMQGTAADIIKRAMLNVATRLSATALPARMILQVHDELVLEVRTEAIEPVRALLIEAMTSAATLSIPLTVAVGVGENWDAAH